MENRHKEAGHSQGAAGTASRAASRVFRTYEALAAERGGPLAPIARQLGWAWERLGQPMRLVVVGQIKRGKSTLVNALLGEEVAATGQLELTFTISEFCHGDDRVVFVRYKDGTSEGPLPPAALEGLTVRDPARLGQLRRIRKVEFVMPNELLRTFRLVDTPGLGSVHLIDAQNTVDYLGLGSAPRIGAQRSAARDTLDAMGRTAADVHEESVREIVEADAVLYLFSRGLHERDDETVAEFLGDARSSVTPLRAFGVLSLCDRYWPPDRDLPGHPDPVTYDPMDAARLIADRYMADSRTGRLFFTVVPIAGLVGIGARLLTGEEFGWLDQLRMVEPKVLARRLGDAQRFATATQLPDVPLPVAMRERLIRRLGAWGTYRACGYLRDGEGQDKVRDRLVADSGVTQLRELIAGHFGSRASTIKLDHGLRDVAAEIGRCRAGLRRAGEEVPVLVDVIAAQVERLRISDHDSAELSVLAACYNQELDLDEAEVAEIRAVTGENGPTWAARLGQPENTPVRELRAEAERLVAKWAQREQDPTLNRATLRAAHTIRLSYDRILHQIPPPTSGSR